MSLSKVGVIRCLFTRTTGDVFLEDDSVAIGSLAVSDANETDRSEVRSLSDTGLEQALIGILASDNDSKQPLSTQLLRGTEADRCILRSHPQNVELFFALSGEIIRSRGLMTAMKTVHSDNQDH